MRIWDKMNEHQGTCSYSAPTVGKTTRDDKQHNRSFMPLAVAPRACVCTPCARARDLHCLQRN